MTIYSVLPLIAAVINISLLFFVLINNRKKDIILSYILWNLSMLIWNLGLFLLYNAKNIQLAYKYNHILIFGTMFIFPTFFNFIINFTKQKTKRNKILIYSAYFLSFLFLLFHFKFNILSNNLEKYFWGYYPVAQIGDRIYTIIFFLFTIYPQILLYKLIKISSGQKRNQYQYIFWGIIIGYSGCLTSFLPPFGIEVYPVGNLITILISVAVAYALITVKMVNLKYLIKRTALFIGVLAIGILINSAIVFLVIPNTVFMVIPKNLHSIILSIFLVAGLTIFFSKIYRNKVNKYIASKFHTSKIQNQLIKIRNSLNKRQLIENIFSVIPKIFMIEKSIVKLQDTESFIHGKFKCENVDQISCNITIDKKKKHDIFLEYFADKKEIIVKDEIEKKIEIGKPTGEKEIKIYDEMNNNKFAITIPVGEKSENKGYILLGNKFSGDMFNTNEIDFLILLKQSIEVALKNIENIDLIKKQQQEIDRETQKANRLESIGFLAGGIAHDFNNILTNIVGNLSLLMEDMNLEGEIIEILTESEDAARKAKNLTQQLLTFSKGEAPVKHVTSISKLLKDSVKFVLRGSNSKYRIFIPDDIWLVKIDEFQISQVVNNLIINADQAMQMDGMIGVLAENITINSGDSIFLKEGKYVKISIKDQGCGIPKEHINKIFDLYYTTKQKGSGLGLATAYSIIKKHNGCINVESEIDVGTSFDVYLPAIVTKKKLEDGEGKKIIKGAGKVLFVDDDIDILKTSSRMLNDIGYKCETACNGIEAVNLYKKAKASRYPFDCVILDLTIPSSIDCGNTMKKLIEIDPDVKAVASSGYSNKPIMSNPEKYGFKDILPKPYNINEMSLLLHKIISGY